MIQAKVRVLAIAPYEEMTLVMQHALDSFPDVEMDIFVGDLEEGVNIVKNTQQNMYDCIISRGGTASLIKDLTHLPVIAINLSVYDVLSAMKLAENYTEKYAFVGFSNITETAHTLCSILGSKIDIVTVKTREEVLPALENLKQQGYPMVVCDKVAHTIARSIGLESFLITSGVESIQDAIKQAVDICTHFSNLRQENTFLRMITNDQNSLIVVMDVQGHILLSSPSTPSSTLLESLKQNLVGIPTSKATRFYCMDKDIFYKVSSQTVIMNSNALCLFYCVPSRIPLNTNLQKGLRSMNKSECEYTVQNSFYSISGAMGTLSDEINSYSRSKMPLMLIGENGTGKEQIAKYIYLKGAMTNRPFVIINCKLLNEKSYDFLLGSDNSPLNELNITIYFQNFEFFPSERLHDLTSSISDTGLTRRMRLIFSCNTTGVENLSEDMTKFMRRLGCVTLLLPTLRSRADEIPSLASMYLSNLKLESGKQLSGFEPKALEMLRKYQWADNYTQFKKVLEILSDRTMSGYIRSADVAEVLAKEAILLNPKYKSLKSEPQESSLTLNEIITNAVLHAVEANNGNRTKAAQQLGISRTTLWRYLDKGENKE